MDVTSFTALVSERQEIWWHPPARSTDEAHFVIFRDAPGTPCKDFRCERCNNFSTTSNWSDEYFPYLKFSRTL